MPYSNVYLNSSPLGIQNVCFLYFSHRNINRLKDLVAEHLDHLHYLNDILCLNIDNLNLVLSDHLMNILLIPLYLFSLVRESSKEVWLSE